MMGNSRDNTGRTYEILVQAIFQAIHDQDEVANLTVEHNKTLQGEILSHQIDVYWKFESGGITHEAVVQAKDWQSRVKQGQLVQFKSVIKRFQDRYTQAMKWRVLWCWRVSPRQNADGASFFRRFTM